MFTRTYPRPLRGVVKICPLRSQTQPASIDRLRLGFMETQETEVLAFSRGVHQAELKQNLMDIIESLAQQPLTLHVSMMVHPNDDAE